MRTLFAVTLLSCLAACGQPHAQNDQQPATGIRTENALLSAYIFVDIRERDIGSYVKDARKAVADQVKFPPGYYITWSGQFEYMERAVEKMKVVIPVTLLTSRLTRVSCVVSICVVTP